jgi:hypothetical protein
MPAWRSGIPGFDRPEVIDNARLIYTAQGVTNDGKSYLSVVSPVKTKALPDKGDVSKMTPAAYKKFSATFSDFATKVGAKLDQLPPASFEPNLADLDKLVKSIESSETLAQSAIAITSVEHSVHDQIAC